MTQDPPEQQDTDRANGQDEQEDRLSQAATGNRVSQARFRESVTALIALLIVAFALWIMGDYFILTGKTVRVDPDGIEQQVFDEIQKMISAFEAKQLDRRKTILDGVYALLGVVMGYYFGRIPAELRANMAEQQSKEAQSTTDKAIKEVSQTKEQVSQIEFKLADARRTLAEAVESMEGSSVSDFQPAKAPVTGGEASRALNRLRDLQKRI